MAGAPTAKQQGVSPRRVDPKTGKLTGNGKYTYQKTTAYDKNALALFKEDPTLTPYQIGKKLKALGKAKSDTHIYRRLKRSEYLSAEFARIEKYHMEQLHRDIYPIAAKRWKKALKDKKLSAKDVMPYVKLAADKVFGETHKHVGQRTINIASVERMQAIIGNDLEVAQKDA